MSFKLKLTPISRIMMSLAEEIDHAPHVFLRPKIIDGYVTQLAEVEKRRDAVLKTFIYSATALAFILAGNDLNIPYLDISASKIPVIVELLTIISSFSFLIVCHTLVLHSAYEMCISVLSGKEAGDVAADDDLIRASKWYFDFVFKGYRTKFHSSGNDFFVPGISLRIAWFLLSLSVSLILILVPAIHVTLVFYSFNNSMVRYDGSFAYLLYFAAVALMNMMVSH